MQLNRRGLFGALGAAFAAVGLRNVAQRTEQKPKTVDGLDHRTDALRYRAHRDRLNRELSRAMERAYADYLGVRPDDLPPLPLPRMAALDREGTP